jgi:hypothetical protein
MGQLPVEKNEKIRRTLRPTAELGLHVLVVNVVEATDTKGHPHELGY